VLNYSTLRPLKSMTLRKRKSCFVPKIESRFCAKVTKKDKKRKHPRQKAADAFFMIAEEKSLLFRHDGIALHVEVDRSSYLLIIIGNGALDRFFRQYGTVNLNGGETVEGFHDRFVG